MTQRPEEQEAVYTTIVGGRPPGCGSKVGNIPRGVEILVKKAAVDPAFKERLLADRAGAAEDIELELDPAESMLLRAIPEKQLEMIIDQTVVPKEQKPAFLGRVAASMLLALGIGFTATAGEPMSLGIRPEDERRTEKTDPRTEMLKRKADLEKQMTELMRLKAEAGKIFKEEGKKELQAEFDKMIDGRFKKLALEVERVAQALKNIEERPLPATRGVRPDRPRLTKGIRPDKPIKSEGEEKK